MSTAPDSVKQKLLEILEEAIEQERLSQQRYALGASLATDPAVEEMLLRRWRTRVHCTLTGSALPV
ncbi:MAG: hypothetical protein CEE40_10500 [Chloroflexi bacterium B3_Chlor]|nr:MAG: hypothetical protein CEE40_10500 [Chloroflexi bacterium B3_Chlor]